MCTGEHTGYVKLLKEIRMVYLAQKIVFCSLQAHTQLTAEESTTSLLLL